MPGSRAVCEMTGSMRRYDTARLKSLYKDRNEYIRRFNAAVDQAVEEGRLVKEDAAALKAPGREDAARVLNHAIEPAVHPIAALPASLLAERTLEPEVCDGWFRRGSRYFSS